MASAARLVAEVTESGLSLPDKKRVGTWTPANWPGRYSQLCSTLPSLGAVWAPERIRGQRSRPQGRYLGGCHLEYIEEHPAHHRLRITTRQSGFGFLNEIWRVSDTETRLVQNQMLDIGGEIGATHCAVGPVGMAPEDDGSL